MGPPGTAAVGRALAGAERRGTVAASSGSPTSIRATHYGAEGVGTWLWVARRSGQSHRWASRSSSSRRLRPGPWQRHADLLGGADERDGPHGRRQEAAGRSQLHLADDGHATLRERAHAGGEEADQARAPNPAVPQPRRRRPAGRSRRAAGPRRCSRSHRPRPRRPATAAPTSSRTQFAGLAQATSPDTSGEPPDPWVAAGPEHIVQAVNLSLRITDRQGGGALDLDLPTFFQLPPNTFDSDPHVIYDSLHGRWLATEVSWDCDASRYPACNFGHGYIDFAVSRTADPTGSWDIGLHLLPGSPAGLPGAREPAPTRSGSPATSSGWSRATDCVRILPVPRRRRDLHGLGRCARPADRLTVLESVFPASTHRSRHPTDWFTPRVAVQVPATSSRMHIVAQYDFGTGTIGLGYVAAARLGKGRHPPLRASRQPYRRVPTGDRVRRPDPGSVAPRQPGSPATITEAVDSRPTDAIWQGDRLVLVSTAGCTPTSRHDLRDCVRVTELDTSTVGSGAERHRHPQAGLPGRQERRGPVHGRRRPDRRWDPSRWLDRVVGERQRLPVVVDGPSTPRRHLEHAQRR